MSLQQRIGSGDGADEQPALQPRIGVAGPNRSIDRFSELRLALCELCVATIGPELQALSASSKDLRSRVLGVVEAELARRSDRLTSEERRQVIEDVVDDVLGYGPIDPFLRDDEITEIMVNGYDQVFVEREGVLYETDVRFADDDHVMRVVERIVGGVGRRVDEASPMVDARLPDGSRVNVILPPLALNGPVMTIRKFSADAMTADDLIARGSVSRELVEVLERCVQGKLNVLISGGTGVGKTTLLNVLSAFIPGAERVVTIEDSAELQLKQRHVVSLEARPANIEGHGEIGIRQLVRNALRMRPDRIVVGEVRGAETVDMLQAMNTGHEGSLTTIHANSPRDALARLEVLVLMAGVDLPLRAIREQISSAFDVVIQLTRFADGSRRVTHVTEVLRMESDVVTIQDLFVAKPEVAADGSLAAKLRPTGVRPQFADKLAGAGFALPVDAFDPGVAPIAASAKRRSS